MRLFKLTFFIALFCMTTISCKKDTPTDIETTGTIQKQGITTYQYGTHITANYALRSSTLDLDDFVGQQVTLLGNLVEGYPVDGGPEYLDVVEIK